MTYAQGKEIYNKNMTRLFDTIKLGADPELFVYDKIDKTFVSSIGLIGGTKMFPRPTSVDGFFLQEDNVLVEFNIPPANDVEEFKYNLKTGMKLFEEVLPVDRYALEVMSSHNFKPEQLDDPRAMEFGCEPDMNAWRDGKINPKPANPEDGLRSAGGHIHIGYGISDKAIEDNLLKGVSRSDLNQQLVKWCDLFLAVPSMKMDLDTKRRKLYGKAGAYRDKTYGVEYRTLSSFWLKTDGLIEWAWDQTMRAITKVDSLTFLNNNLSEKIEAAVNYGDKRAIDSLFSEYKLQVA